MCYFIQASQVSREEGPITFCHLIDEETEATLKQLAHGHATLTVELGMEHR